MSYSFDIMLRTWKEELKPSLVQHSLAHSPQRLLINSFQRLIKAMHEANHKVPSWDGSFQNDGVDKDIGVANAAHALSSLTSRTKWRRSLGDELPRDMTEDKTAASGLKRLTCKHCQSWNDANPSGPTLKESSLVKQPCMNEKTWKEARELFIMTHRHPKEEKTP